MEAATWLYNTLSGDTTLAGKVGARIYRDSAPEGTAFPFLAYQLVDVVPVYNAFSDELMEAERWQIKAVDIGHDYSDIETIAARVKTLLHKKSASGVVSAVFIMKMSLSESDNGETYKTIILDFRVHTQ